MKALAAIRWLAPLALSALLVASAGCGGRAARIGGDADVASDGGGGDGATDGEALDADAADDVGPVVDASPDGRPDGDLSPCDCAIGEVYRRHPCIPTVELGCGEPCDTETTDCGEGHRCELCAASTTCATRDCRATCIHSGPVMNPVTDPLRITPTVGPVGVATEVRIEGFPFYVGALFYNIWVGDEMLFESGGGGECQLGFRVPEEGSGRQPVWVSGYGGGEPVALAGFFTFDGGEGECVQPGFPCRAPSECCSTADVPMECAEGRCARTGT